MSEEKVEVWRSLERPHVERQHFYDLEKFWDVVREAWARGCLKQIIEILEYSLRLLLIIIANQRVPMAGGGRGSTGWIGLAAESIGAWALVPHRQRDREWVLATLAGRVLEHWTVEPTWVGRTAPVP